jgi:hypothetical protein
MRPGFHPGLHVKNLPVLADIDSNTPRVLFVSANEPIIRRGFALRIAQNRIIKIQ